MKMKTERKRARSWNREHKERWPLCRKYVLEKYNYVKTNVYKLSDFVAQLIICEYLYYTTR